MDSFTLHPLSPFRLDLTVWALRRVPANEMDRWDGNTYSRTLVIDDAPVEVSVRQTAPPDKPELTVTAEGPGAMRREEIAHELEKMLGLKVDLAPFFKLVGSSRLAPLVEQFMGFKPPRLGSVFEALLNGIVCQQISMTVGIHLLNRMCRMYGRSVGDHHAFPRSSDFAGSTIGEVKAVGLTTRKAEYILGLSRMIATGTLDLDALEKMDDETAIASLLKLHGIGRWTAEYTALRGLGRIDIFPADDVGAQTKLQRWLGLPARPSYEEVHRLLDKWAPYRGLVYFYLLLDGQLRQGLFV